MVAKLDPESLSHKSLQRLRERTFVHHVAV
jgi:hypothetical protein